MESNGFEKLIIVTGYRSQMIRDYVSAHDCRLDVTFVHNELFDTTNNIYSLYKVASVLDEPFMLIEADLMFEHTALSAFREPDRIALDFFNPQIHNGTTATVQQNGYLEYLFIGDEKPDLNDIVFKTVNITSFSVQTWMQLVLEIETLIDQGHTDIFYEYGIRELVTKHKSSFKMVDFSQYWWDEVDSMEDLNRVASYIEARMDVEA